MAQARFFCENCGEEVKQNAKFCGKCGRFFINVKCPRCGKIGAQHLFTKGCPYCGYATGLQSQNASSNRNAKVSTEGLPAWLYLVIIGGLLGLVVFLFKYLM